MELVKELVGEDALMVLAMFLNANDVVMVEGSCMHQFMHSRDWIEGSGVKGRNLERLPPTDETWRVLHYSSSRTACRG